MVKTLEERRAQLKERIAKRAFVQAHQQQIISKHKKERTKGWLFDIRAILLDAESLENISALFWEKFGGKYPFQIGGIETAAIPLITALVTHIYQQGHVDASGFYMRK